jgi:hypothetical protein
MKNRPILIFLSEPCEVPRTRLLSAYFYLPLKSDRIRKRSSSTPALNLAAHTEYSIHAGDKLIIVDSLSTVDLKTLQISSAHVLIGK